MPCLTIDPTCTPRVRSRATPESCKWKLSVMNIISTMWIYHNINVTSTYISYDEIKYIAKTYFKNSKRVNKFYQWYNSTMHLIPHTQSYCKENDTTWELYLYNLLFYEYNSYIFLAFIEWIRKGDVPYLWGHLCSTGNKNWTEYTFSGREPQKKNVFPHVCPLFRKRQCSFSLCLQLPFSTAFAIDIGIIELRKFESILMHSSSVLSFPWHSASSTP